MADLNDYKRITPSYRPVQAPSMAPCQAGCANCGDIRGWIGIVAQRAQSGIGEEEAFARAWQKISEVNPFPATLGRICPHPCENRCNRAEKDEALAINAMERFLGDYAITADLPLPVLQAGEQGVFVGVVGAGPSGLSFAYQMRRRGYRVTVYDARPKPGGMLRYGIPDYRLPARVLDAEIQKIVDLGVEIKMNTAIGRDISLRELQDRHDCLYLGIGAQQGQQLNIPGIEGEGVFTAIDLLGRINAGDSVKLGHRVIVVGGGNSAMDAARTARRQGAEVTLLYRRALGDMPASECEIEEAVEEDVELILLASPVKVERDEKGRLVAVHAMRMELGDLDSSGRGRPVPIEGSDFRLEASSLVSAVSQVPQLEGLEELASEGGWLVAAKNGSLGNNLFTGGDSMGAGIAGNAIVQGRYAAESLHLKFAGSFSSPLNVPVANPDANRVQLDSKPSGKAVRPARRQGKTRIQNPAAEVHETISPEQFLQEVERCFSCGSCFACGRCHMYCTAGCFTRVEEVSPGQYFSLNLDNCHECGKCVEVCPCGFLAVT